MKKVISLFLLVFLVVTSFAGCSGSGDKKSEEDLKAEIKAEMEAEEKLREEIKAELEAEMPSKQKDDSSEVSQADKTEANKPAAAQPVNTSQAEAKPAAKDDLSQGYSYKVESGSLKISYNNTGNTKTLISGNNIYTINKDGGTMKEKLYVLNVSKKEGTKIYFTVKAPEYSVGDVAYYMDVQTMKIYWIGSNVGSGSSSQSTPAAGTEESTTKLEGFKAESINGTHVEYSDYTSVVVPMYNGANKSMLSDAPLVMGSVTQGFLSMRVNLAIFGYMQNIKITFNGGPDVEEEVLEVESLYNANVDLQVWLPGMDGSYVRIEGEAFTSTGEYSYMAFNIDDMRDASEYDPIMVE